VTPSVSLVVPFYNARDTLPLLVESLEKQSLPAGQFEAIFVDDGSADGSSDILRDNSHIRLLVQENSGPGAARNAGIDAARGDVIVTVDADCFLPADFLAEHLRLHGENPGLHMICGSILPGRPLPWGSAVLADHLSNWFDHHPGLPEGDPENIHAANLSIKREVVSRDIRWSEKRVTGEDIDYAHRVRRRGMSIRFVPGVAVFHVDRASCAGFLRHQYNWGFHAPFKRGSDPNDRYGKLFPSAPWKAWCLFPLIVAGYFGIVMLRWLPHRPFGTLTAAPLVFLGKIWYGLGVIAGTRAMREGLGDTVADRRL